MCEKNFEKISLLRKKSISPIPEIGKSRKFPDKSDFIGEIFSENWEIREKSDFIPISLLMANREIGESLREKSGFSG